MSLLRLGILDLWQSSLMRQHTIIVLQPLNSLVDLELGRMESTDEEGPLIIQAYVQSIGIGKGILRVE
ncbi:MAG: hypothetical protein GX998_09950 [Firmicutes bacterium]|nr:hypothetical protein [Bacillota bacterium]